MVPSAVEAMVKVIEAQANVLAAIGKHPDVPRSIRVMVVRSLEATDDSLRRLEEKEEKEAEQMWEDWNASNDRRN